MKNKTKLNDKLFNLVHELTGDENFDTHTSFTIRDIIRFL